MAEPVREERLSSKDIECEIVRRVYARIGLLGNPSDGFFGKTISLSLQNFYAEVRGPVSAASRMRRN